MTASKLRSSDAEVHLDGQPVRTLDEARAFLIGWILPDVSAKAATASADLCRGLGWGDDHSSHMAARLGIRAPKKLRT